MLYSVIPSLLSTQHVRMGTRWQIRPDASCLPGGFHLGWERQGTLPRAVHPCARGGKHSRSLPLNDYVASFPSNEREWEFPGSPVLRSLRKLQGAPGSVLGLKRKSCMHTAQLKTKWGDSLRNTRWWLKFSKISFTLGSSQGDALLNGSEIKCRPISLVVCPSQTLMRNLKESTSQILLPFILFIEAYLIDNVTFISGV